MKPISFVKSLLPSIKKDTIIEDIRTVRGELKDTVCPVYEQGAQLMKNWKFKSAEVQAVLRVFSDLCKSSGNIVVSIDKNLPTVLENLEEVEAYIDRVYSDTVAAAGVTYLKAQLLQYVEAAGFFASYGRRLLNFIYVYETAPFVKEEDANYDPVKAALSPAEMEYVETNIHNFCAVYNALTNPSADLRKRLAEIPDIVVTDDNAHTLVHTVGEKKLDPGLFGFIPVSFNPIYHVRMAIAEWQIGRYKQSETELQMLQMRALNLEQLIKNQPNAALQKRLEETRDRVEDTRAYLRKMEEAYA